MGVEAVYLRLTHVVSAVQNLAKEDQATIRSAIIDEVLATDMKRHFNIISTFQVGLGLNHDLWQRLMILIGCILNSVSTAPQASQWKGVGISSVVGHLVSRALKLCCCWVY